MISRRDLLKLSATAPFAAMPVQNNVVMSRTRDLSKLDRYNDRLYQVVPESSVVRGVRVFWTGWKRAGENLALAAQMVGWKNSVDRVVIREKRRGYYDYYVALPGFETPSDAGQIPFGGVFPVVAHPHATITHLSGDEWTGYEDLLHLTLRGYRLLITQVLGCQPDEVNLSDYTS